MPKPSSKRDLLLANAEAFKCIQQLIDALPRKALDQTFLFPHRDRNVRDVLAHLLEWQHLMFDWYAIGMAGGQPEMPAPGFTWRTTPALNQSIWDKCQSQSFRVVYRKLQASHNRLQQLIELHTNSDLFTKRKYHWTGSTSLGVCCTSAGWSHYQWALKLLRRFAKQMNSDQQH